jgi:hypothetical protein
MLAPLSRRCVEAGKAMSRFHSNGMSDLGTELVTPKFNSDGVGHLWLGW